MNVSKNALSQALKVVKPDISKQDLFALIEVPACFTTTTRYWNLHQQAVGGSQRRRTQRSARKSEVTARCYGTVME